MDQTQNRKVYRKPWIAAIAGVAAAVWLLNAVLNVVWFGELSVLNIALPLLWAFVAVLYARPYAVANTDAITLAIAPLRPRTLAWNQIVSFDEVKPGIARLGLADGGKLTFRLKDARVQDQEYLRSVLQPRSTAPVPDSV